MSKNVNHFSVYTRFLMLGSTFLLSSLLHWGCKTPKSKLDNAVSNAIANLENENPSSQNNLGFVYKSSTFQNDVTKPYQKTPDKIWTLNHTDLDLFLNWEQQTVNGYASLILSNNYHPQLNRIELNAQGMDIHQVWLDTLSANLKPNFKQLNIRVPEHKLEPLTTKPKQLGSDTSVKNIEFKHTSNSTWLPIQWDYKDSLTLKIALPFGISRNKSIRLIIAYTANPERSVHNKSTTAGTAISSDKGAYFINHDLKHPVFPRQFWTQGETHASSRWFPTLDHPSQKHTQTLQITYPDTMISISNGKLVSSKNIPQSKEKTDWWIMEKPHSVYLTMLGLGNWVKTEQNVRSAKTQIPVNSFVEPAFQNAAYNHFKHTAEMIDFFSNYTGVDFPWGKFDQVSVRDFVSGAMENTSCVVHNERLMDSENDMEDYVSHELFHHWFGDLATCENWSDLTLNESFATYGEFLWREHKYGFDNAISWMNSNSQISDDAHFKSLVNHYYANPDEQFDDVRYNKGAAILHMLRNYIGDDNFRLSMKTYLTQHGFKTANTNDWKKVIEQVTGRNMDDFFNSWYYSGGKLSVDYYIGRDTMSPTQKGYRLYIHSYANMSSASSDLEMPDGPKLTEYYGVNKTVALPIEWGKLNSDRNRISTFHDTTIYTQADKINYSIYLGETLPDFLIIDPKNTLLSDDISPNYPLAMGNRIQERESSNSNTAHQYHIWTPEYLFDLGYNNISVAPDCFKYKYLSMFFGGYLYVSPNFWPKEIPNSALDSIALNFQNSTLVSIAKHVHQESEKQQNSSWTIYPPLSVLRESNSIAEEVQLELLNKLFLINYSAKNKNLISWSSSELVNFALNQEIYAELTSNSSMEELRNKSIKYIENAVNSNSNSESKSHLIRTLISQHALSNRMDSEDVGDVNENSKKQSKIESSSTRNKNHKFVFEPSSLPLDFSRNYSLNELDSLRMVFKKMYWDPYLHFYSNRLNSKPINFDARSEWFLDSMMMVFAKNHLISQLRAMPVDGQISNEVDVLLPIKDRHLLSRNTLFLFTMYERSYHKIKSKVRLSEEFNRFEEELWNKFFFLPLIPDHRNEILTQLSESLSESLTDELFSALEFENRMKAPDIFALTGGAYFNLSLGECYDKLELIKKLAFNELKDNKNEIPQRFVLYQQNKLKKIVGQTESKTSNRLALMRLNEFLK